MGYLRFPVLLPEEVPVRFVCCLRAEEPFDVLLPEEVRPELLPERLV